MHARAIEYGLIAAGISLAIIAVNGFGTNLDNKFTSINSSLKIVRVILEFAVAG